MRFVGGDIGPDDLRCVAYGQVFRPPGRTLSTDFPVLTAGDVTEGFDQELRALVFDLHQVRRYLTEPRVRAHVQRRVAEAVSADTRVIVAHSLGSVAAYETLCANPQWPVRTLVTLGSPLGIGKLVFDRLQPPPSAGAERHALFSGYIK